MRRPTFCGGSSAAADDDCACLSLVGGASRDDLGAGKEEGRLARVKRMLAGSLSRARRVRAFGVRLDEQPMAGEGGVPEVLARLCGYIENHGLQCGSLFRLSGGNPRLTERLRAQLERTGDADLEGSGDAHSAAQLLKLWLRELPEPVVTLDVAERLLDVHHKFATSALGEWRDAVSDTLSALPSANLRVLGFLAHFLRRCQVAAGTRCRHAGNVEAVFAPLILRQAVAGARCVVAVEVTARLVRDANTLFPLTTSQPKPSGPLDPALDALAEPDVCAGNLRKRKEPNAIWTHAGQEQRKVVRSNSEERALSVCAKDNAGMRRVCSHEDFSLAKNHNNNNNNNNNNSQNNENNQNSNNSFLSELIDPTTGHGVLSQRPCSDVGGVERSDEEHERRRRSERECRAAAQIGRRPAPRRRRQAARNAPLQTTQAGVNEGGSQPVSQPSPLSPVSSSTSEDDAPPCVDDANKHTQEGALSTRHVGAPLRELLRANEPLRSHHWAFAPNQAMLSPRGAPPGGARGGLDASVPPSPPQEHSPRSPRSPRSPAQLDSQLRQLQKQISSVKRKLKRFDERFEREFGYRPSHADKMADREVKHLGQEMLRLRKEMKQLRDESPPVGSDATCPAPGAMEAALREVEQHLASKRESSGRPASIEALTPTQTQEEKLAVQRALLYLESVGGRPVLRAQRDLVRPLYERYRALKRALLRAGAATSKDSISELATILEHEAMNFSSQPPAPAESDVEANDVEANDVEANSSVDASPVEESAAVEDIKADQDLENLHSLPLWRLLEQTRAVREEKRALRRSLREFEADFQRRAGRKLQREDRAPLEARYAAYKQAKARLRLLQALASKHTAH